MLQECGNSFNCPRSSVKLPCDGPEIDLQLAPTTFTRIICGFASKWKGVVAIRGSLRKLHPTGPILEKNENLHKSGRRMGFLSMFQGGSNSGSKVGFDPFLTHFCTQKPTHDSLFDPFLDTDKTHFGPTLWGLEIFSNKGPVGNAASLKLPTPRLRSLEVGGLKAPAESSKVGPMQRQRRLPRASEATRATVAVVNRTSRPRECRGQMRSWAQRLAPSWPWNVPYPILPSQKEAPVHVGASNQQCSDSAYSTHRPALSY